MGTKVYFFQGGSYVRYDRGADGADEGFPVDLGDNWVGFDDAGFGQGVDAALNLEQGKVFFFRGGQYLRFDLDADKVDAGPLPIAGQWPGLAEAGFGAGIDAAVNWGNGKVFLFRGDQYLRYDIALDRADAGYPLPIAGNWPGLAEAGFGAGIDAAVNWGDGYVFFFRGDQYVRYDMNADHADAGYPLPIAGNWPGLAEVGFGQGLRASIDLYDARARWLPGAEVMAPPVNGPVYISLPWRGVLHTTEGPTIAGALSTFQATNFWPTLTIEPNTLRVVQHYTLSRGARALSDHATAENAARCVQIEIVGFAAQSPTWAPEQLAFIRDVMRQIEDLVPIPRQSDRIFLDSAGVAANPGNRMSVDEWKRFSGWCGHQHVPGESHWDPGAIEITTLLTT